MTLFYMCATSHHPTDEVSTIVQVEDEGTKRQCKCSSCGIMGHNKRGCKHVWD